MGALLEPMLLLPTHMYVPESDILTSGMSRVPMSVRSMRAWGRTHTVKPGTPGMAWTWTFKHGLY